MTKKTIVAIEEEEGSIKGYWYKDGSSPETKKASRDEVIDWIPDEGIEVKAQDPDDKTEIEVTISIRTKPDDKLGNNLEELPSKEDYERADGPSKVARRVLKRYLSRLNAEQRQAKLTKIVMEKYLRQLESSRGEN